MGVSGLWCNNCAMSLSPQVFDDVKLCCSFCGKVLSEYNWSEEVTFAKNAAGQYKRKLDIQGTKKDEKVHIREDDETGGDCDFDDSHGSNNLSGKSGEESDTLSDIDDFEIDSYIHTEKEKHYKKIIWEELNREYVEREQQKRAKEARNSVPPRTASEATRQMQEKKTLESKINYVVLDELFNESISPEKAKKSRLDEGGTKAKRKIDGRTLNWVRKLNMKM